MSFLKHQKETPEFLNNFLKYRRYIEFFSQNSVNEMFYDIRTFFRYLKIKEENPNNFNLEHFKKINISDITIDDLLNINKDLITNYIFFLDYQLHNNVKTRNRKLASIKRLFEYLYDNNYININPSIHLKSAPTGKRLPKYLNLNESKQLLASTIKSNKLYKIRDYCITNLFLNCGIRLSELTNIDLTDLKLDEHTLKVTGKGDKERIIYLNDSTMEAIKEYLKVRPKLDKSYIDFNALFLSSRNKRISRRNVQQIIKNELEIAFKDNKNDIHTHSLRHTCASLLYNENNTNILIIKKMLGHLHLSSTEIYTHVSSKKMQDIMNNFTISSIIERKDSEQK